MFYHCYEKKRKNKNSCLASCSRTEFVRRHRADNDEFPDPRLFGLSVRNLYYRYVQKRYEADVSLFLC